MGAALQASRPPLSITHVSLASVLRDILHSSPSCGETCSITAEDAEEMLTSGVDQVYT